MHACGHDIHVTTLIGTARLLAQLKDRWRGTLMLIGQPAEEAIGGARAMLNDGLYSRFPKPNYAIALHVTPFEV
jgi:hippurate hydrolase